MFSERFQKNIQITDHARQSMAKRGIDEGLVLEIIETGETNYKDDLHLWIYKHIPMRDDNLLCVAAVDAQAIIVKTVMTNWKIKELPK